MLRHPFFLFGLRLAFGLTILGLAIHVVDWKAVATAVVSIDPLWLFLAFLFTTACSIVIPAIITSQTLRAGNLDLRLGELVRINFAMRFYVLTLPHAVTVGMRWQRYRGANKGRGWQIAALILFERIVQFTVVVVFALLFLHVVGSDLPETFRFLLPVSGVMSLVGLVVLLSFLSCRVFSLASSVTTALIRFSPQLFATRIERLTAAISDYQRLQNKHVIFVFFWSVCAHLMFVASAYFVARGMSISIGFADLGWMRSVIFLLTVLPITVGGLGVREVGFATLLYLHEVDKSQALAFPLILLAIQLMLGFIGALLEGRQMFARREGSSDAGS